MVIGACLRLSLPLFPGYRGGKDETIEPHGRVEGHEALGLGLRHHQAVVKEHDEDIVNALLARAVGQEHRGLFAFVAKAQDILEAALLADQQAQEHARAQDQPLASKTRVEEHALTCTQATEKKKKREKKEEQKKKKKEKEKKRRKYSGNEEEEEENNKDNDVEEED
jgi:hypothetical protein